MSSTNSGFFCCNNTRKAIAIVLLCVTLFQQKILQIQLGSSDSMLVDNTHSEGEYHYLKLISNCFNFFQKKLIGSIDCQKYFICIVLDQE